MNFNHESRKWLSCLLVTSIIVAGNAPGVWAEDKAVASSNPVSVSAGPIKNDNLTLELQGVSIFDVFKILSKKSGLNIVAGKNVQGQVSIFLQDVPVKEALQTILQSQGLASVEENGIIKVMTEDEFFKKYGRPYQDNRVTKSFNVLHSSAEQLASKLSEIKSPSGKIITEVRTNTLIITEIPKILEDMENLIRESDQELENEVFHLNYTKVEDLEPKLKTIMEGTSGKCEIDKRSNQVIVFDIPSRIARVRSLVEAFDVKPPQVLISAQIIEVRLSDSYRKGIDWQEIINEVGNFDTIEAIAPLVVAPPAGASALATLSLDSSRYGLQSVLSLLEQMGKTNLLSSPRLMVLNNEEAKLAVATKQPFVSQTIVQTTNSTNTADNVQFVDVGVTLKVQPRISRDDYVEMKVKPEVSSSNSSLDLQSVAEGSNTAYTRTSIPIVTSQELETSVQIKSGHTLIIGGLIEDHQEKSSTRLPVLHSIPLLGRLFESNSDDFSKSELVIFLTPIIVSPSDSNSSERFLSKDGVINSFEDFGGYKTDTAIGLLGSKKAPYWEMGNNKPASSAVSKETAKNGNG